jgi:glyoxylate reductase
MITRRVSHGKEDSVRPSIFLSRRVPDAVHCELEARFDLRVLDDDRASARAELLAGVAGCAGVVLMLTDRVDEELLDAAGPDLQVVANYAVGFDNVDLEAATRRGVLVANTPDVLTEATAELTIALLLDVARRVSEGDRIVRSGARWEWSPTFMLGRTLRGRTLGIVGLGRIGREVARLGSALGMEIVFTRGKGPPFESVELPDLLARSHVVSLHCPLTPETHHLISAAELAAMRPDAILVNTSRGPVVDEEALAEALAAGEIAGAGLDVYEHEPEVPEALRALPNVVLAPHLGSATEETRTAMGMLCVEALRAVLLERRKPPNALNPEAFRG